MLASKRLVAPLFLLALAPALASADDDEKQAYYKACPGLEAWAKAHPSHAAEAANASAGKEDAITAPALRDELHRRVKADHRVREHAFADGKPPEKAAMEAWMAVDRDNLQWLHESIGKQGFPSIAQVGEQGVDDAFVLVQHADADPALQQSVLESLGPRLATAGISRQQYAMLTDRVLVAQGKPQRFGSQYDLAKDGSFVLKPTEDPAGLEARREQMGLMPSKFYECVLRTSLQ
jgi:hypothetical protein